MKALRFDFKGELNFAVSTSDYDGWPTQQNSRPSKNIQDSHS
jgi:hypothetical protein